MSEEWGPWIEHDGSSDPVSAGNYCQCEFDGSVKSLISLGLDGKYWKYVSDRVAECWTDCDNQWDWDDVYARIIRYRVRKQKGLKILEALLHDLPESVDA